MESLGLVLIDPYNDFLSVGGKSWPLTRRTPNFGRRIDNMRRLLDGCRSSDVPVFYAPHTRHRGDTYDDRSFLNPSVFLADLVRAFRARGWGGQVRTELAPAAGDLVATEHATSSGFVGTNLEDLLDQHGVDHIAVCGALSNTCVESTVRSAIDLDFRVTVVTDALVAMSRRDDAAARSSFRHICHERATTDALLTEIEGCSAT